MKAHSERVPGKNIKLLNGKPLFFYIADTLKDVDAFDVLAINTDSEDIAKLAVDRYGKWVQIIRRPKALVGDHVSMNLIIDHDVDLLGIEHDFFQTHSTNPMLSVSTIFSAVNVYKSGKENHELDSLFSVNELRTRLYTKNLKPINHDPQNLGRTQDLEVIYEENSNFYIFSGESFLGKRHRIGLQPKAYVMNRNDIEAIDIDNASDWSFAEKLLIFGDENEQ
jgi:CMP-N-acetylneuraminic acid synthetase